MESELYGRLPASLPLNMLAHELQQILKPGSQYDAGITSATSIVSVTGKSIVSLVKLYP